MALQNDILERYYSTDWSESTQSLQSHLIFPLQHSVKQSAGAMEKIFLPFAGAL